MIKWQQFNAFGSVSHSAIVHPYPDLLPIQSGEGMARRASSGLHSE